ncbi:hypothetical protein [Geodermatophilus ruber]|uniref:Uncharacterized protein n=1 Tax=Geodermatophilus ruber TaxID=504800 RepID=A0A1I4C094_9ACTN|nr:hypothetical protein [Geodermatophilus ruber]SFK74060.1 hypothetical protein SAMN04488085_103269 [Geodermatophilus ruber]
MPHIDVVADLNFEGDEAGVILARVPAAGAPAVGTILTAGTAAAWSRVRVEAVDEDGWLHVRLLSGQWTG